MLNEYGAYDKIVAQTRIEHAMMEASDNWCETHPPVDGDDRTPYDAYHYGLITESEFWTAHRDHDPQNRNPLTRAGIGHSVRNWT